MQKPEILFENNDVLVINKPAGLIVHSDGRTKEYSVADWVLENYPEVKDVGEPWTSPQGEVVHRPGIVHRLDRTTSGVMILAKTKEAHAFLKQQFQDRTTEKTYRAFVYGHPKADAGVIEKEIVRIKSTPPRWGVARAGEDKKNRAAITEWKVLQRGKDPATGELISVLLVSPKTGRTHQIRVHLKAINHPIITDHLYASGKAPLLGFSRPALHAERLTITLPNGEKKTFEAPQPSDMELAAAQIQGFAENA
ncbi:RluA family pseudouridine synthase [Patescibacteria group bacterium]|nr:RluA family pseudouridine synthase [Patescibacteria group bacterium]